MRAHNFSAGPGTLPQSVLDEVRRELPLYGSVGSSIMEISHRSPEYTAIEASARSRLHTLLGLGDGWHILFLQGGASMQFYQVPLNFLPNGGVAVYIVTGTWAKKALKEAARVGVARVAASSEKDAFAHIPTDDELELDPDAAYLHFTSNNTVYGTQFRKEPASRAPLVCDASSDFLSRSIDLERYGLIYAGAQKNIGPAGVTIVLVRDEFLRRRNLGLPTMLDYGTHAAKCFNTPPVFAIYVVEKVLGWLVDLGGIEAVEKRNRDKAKHLYTRIDSSDFYRGTAREESRSLMNVTFRLPEKDLEERFVAAAKSQGLVALKGHRSVGGIRASIYNACPPEAVTALVDFMDDFERTCG